MDNQSRVFATILPAVSREFDGHGNEQGLEVRTVHRHSPGSRTRMVQVTGAAELRCPADQASVRISVSSSKDSVSEVTDSVSRRTQYILQSLRQHGVCVEDTSTSKLLRREEDSYHMEAEVTVTFSDFEKMGTVCGVLLEKLDKSVCVGLPHFYHSEGCLSQLRKRVCVSAVENAQQKASDVSRLLEQSLGPPLLIREEETREWRHEEEQDSVSSSHLLRPPTITASTRVTVTFGLKDRNKKKH